MFNANKPSLDELPSTAQLNRSTLIAAFSAILILLTVILPAEYGIDPTGAGRMLGLTDMGEIKQELEEEVERDQKLHGDSQSFNLLESILSVFIGTAQAQDRWRDTITFTLQPGDYTETKFVMNRGDQVQYAWTTEGGRINFDLHAHGGGQSKTYEKGRGATEGEGNIAAPFDGEHGWFWRNRDKSAVTITLRISGDYLEILR